MKRTVNKCVGVLLACVMLLALLPVTVLADETPEIVASGYCGGEEHEESAAWVLTSDGTLTISGNGVVYPEDKYYHPWQSHIQRIRNVVLETGITGISGYLLSGLYVMQTISFPDTLEYLSPLSSFLSSAMYFSKYIVDPNNPYFSTDENSFLYNKDHTVFYNCPRYNSGTVTLPESVKVIDDYAFFMCNITAVNIPYGVTQLGSNVFSECGLLKEITLPNSVTQIGAGLFWGCNQLQSVTLSQNITEITDNMFLGCNALNSFVVPENVTVIGRQAFCSTWPLNEIYLPVSLTRIENGAFASTGLKHIYYAGSEEQWNQVSLGYFGYSPDQVYPDLTIHFNYHEHTPASPARENEFSATCTEAGSYDEVVYCAHCDYEFSRTHVTVNANGHTPGSAVTENSIPATCTANGGYDTVVYCVNCPAELSRTHTAIPAAGHSWGEWEVVKQATAEEEGLMRRTCANDPGHVEEEVIPKLQPNTNTFQQFIQRIRDFFSNIANWFSRLFRF